MIHWLVTSTSPLLESWLEMQILRIHSKITVSKSLGVGPKNLCLNRWCLYILNLEKHYSSRVPQKYYASVAFNGNLLDSKPFVSFLLFLSHFFNSIPVFLEITPQTYYMHLNSWLMICFWGNPYWQVRDHDK